MKTKTIIATAFSILFLPIAVLAESPSWGIGAGVDSSGNWGVSVGVGTGGYGGWTLSNPYGLPQGSILGIASNLLFWLLAIFAILGVVGFIIAGIIYLVSTGDENMISRAKTAMIYSIVGIIVGLSGFLIMQAVAAMLGGSSHTY